MQIGMNSQTLRVEDSHSVIDYNITDGKTSSYMLKVMNGLSVGRLLSMLNDYENKSVESGSDLSWGTDADNMTANMIKPTPMLDVSSSEGMRGAHVPMGPMFGSGGRSPLKIKRRVVKKRTETFTETPKNDQNFGNLFK